jgi:hypothetical protein
VEVSGESPTVRTRQGDTGGVQQPGWATAHKPMEQGHTSSENPTHQGHLLGNHHSGIPPQGASGSSKPIGGRSLKTSTLKGRKA